MSACQDSRNWVQVAAIALVRGFSCLIKNNELMVGDYGRIDFDECAVVSTMCMENSFCNNTIGGYTCTCNEGYLLSGDRSTCCKFCTNTYCETGRSIMWLFSMQ